MTGARLDRRWHASNIGQRMPALAKRSRAIQVQRASPEGDTHEPWGVPELAWLCSLRGEYRREPLLEGGSGHGTHDTIDFGSVADDHQQRDRHRLKAARQRWVGVDVYLDDL